MADAYDFWAARLTREEAAEIDAFWERFGRVARQLDRHLLGRAPEVDAVATMRWALGPLADRLFWEFGAAEPEGRTLAITAELLHSRRALARAAVTRAPALPGWTVTDSRRPVIRVDEALATILFRSRSDSLAVEGAAARRGAHRRVDVVAAGHGDRAFLADQAGVVFSVLLGDIADQNWLGATHATRANRRRSLPRVLARLFGARRPAGAWFDRFRADAVDVISGLEAERPELPFAETRLAGDELAEFRLEPRSDDRSRRADSMRHLTRYRPLVAARVAGAPIASLGFSRFFESFCGIKIARGPGLDQEDLSGVAALARDLETALASAAVGGVTGYGEGLEHVYVDVALEDVEAALGHIRATLARAGVSGPAWLLFDEAGLEDRYVPLTQPSPATPMAAR